MTSVAETELVASLYDAALGRRSWQEIAKAITRLLSSSTLFLALHKPYGNATELVASVGYSDDLWQAYKNHYAPHDLVAAEVVHRHLFDQALLSSDLVDDRTIRRSTIYNEMWRPELNAFHIAGGVLRLPDHELVLLGTHRPERSSAFSRRDAQSLARLLPHVTRALEIRQRLGSARTHATTLENAFDLLPFGVVLVTTQGRVAYANAAADSIIAADDGLSQVEGRLHAQRRSEQDVLARAIAAAGQSTKLQRDANVSPAALTVSRPSGRRSYRLSVSPLGFDRQVLLAHHPVAVVFITDPHDAPATTEQRLRGLFALTPAEARVATAILQGHGLRTAADVLGIGHETARTHLKSILAKTGADRQGAFIRLATTMLASLPAGSPNGGVSSGSCET